jgi:acetyltransferase-like isoleucine patch superfamily enzyme
VVVDREASFEGGNSVGRNTKILNSHLGYATYVGEECFLKNTCVGKYTCIASYVKTISGTHPSSQYVSVHPVFYSKKTEVGFSYSDENYFEEYKWLDKEKKITIEIGNDVWIGEGAYIMDGVTIGDGAIVAAGAVVVKDIPPYAIVGGVPAKVIKYRFEDQQIKKLLELEWWNQDGAWLKDQAINFRNIEDFLQKQG